MLYNISLGTLAHASKYFCIFIFLQFVCLFVKLYELIPSHIEVQMEQDTLIPFITRILIVFLGLIGNCLILVVMNSEKFRTMSTAIYLSALAVSDNSHILVGTFVGEVLPSQLFLHMDIRSLHIAICGICYHLELWSLLTSSWYLVCITVERLIVIVKPHK